MYRVLCDGLPIQDLRDEELVLIDPKVTLEVNTAGSFEFKIAPTHPQYNLVEKFKSIIQVFHDEEEIFHGRATSDKTDFYNRKNIICEGQLAYLNDSIQRPAEYHDMTVRDYLETLISIHNEQVDIDRQFKVGIVTVVDANDSLYRYTNYENTLKAIKEDLIDDLGGYIRVRNVGETHYIDYIKDFDNVCSQSIEFGENLLDFSKNTDLTDIATAVIPLGTRLEESGIVALEERLTIKDVNNGVDYLINAEAVVKYGFIVKTVTWDDVTTPEMLKSKGKRWLTDNQFEEMVLEVKAVDLHYTDEQIEQFKLFDMIPVHSTPHGLNRRFPLSKATIMLNSPSSNKFTLGTTVKVSLTSKTSAAQSAVSKAIETIPVPSAIVEQAIAQATALITAATRGYVVTTANEQLIMDTNDINTAERVWRWNLNGLGYSNTGYNGTYATAITMDGQIVGERLVGGSVSGDKLDITYKTQVTKEIADAEKNARSEAQDYTDEKLKSYYTISEVETSIKNTKDAVLLSAKETSEQYVDGKLKNYSTSAQIKVTTDAISSTVSGKVGYADVISAINQTKETIKIKAAKISLEGLVTANSNFKILTDGSIEARNGTFIGTISGSVVKGSNIIFENDTFGTVSLTGSGLIFNAKGKTDAFGHPGSMLSIKPFPSLMSYGSCIFYEDPDGNGWYGCVASNLNKFKFVFNATSSSYVEMQTIFGAYGISAWSSDRKKKENIDTSNVCGIDEIMKIPHFSYDWKNKQYHVDCGYIAQDMEIINPHYVLKLADRDEYGKATGQYAYQIDETNIIPIITKALQEVIVKVKKLEEGNK